jgi:hypothetical protein
MNNFNLVYNNSSIENVVKYAGPGSICVADFNNLHRPEFQQAREIGVKLYAYRRPISCIVNPDSQVELDYYMGDVSKVPLWGGGRRNNSYTFFTDIRIGSAWVAWMADDIRRLIREGVCDGAFLDVLGARPWGALSDWPNWPAAERAEWTAGAVESMRQMHLARNAEDERFELVCNNIWDLSPNGDPSDALANTGNDYCNGICIEHKASTSAYHMAQAARAFGALPRRVLVLSVPHDGLTAVQDAQAWAALPGVTHVSPQTGSQYGTPVPPAVPFDDTRLAEAEDYAARLKQRLATAEDQADEACAQLSEANQLLASAQATIGSMSIERDSLLARNQLLQGRLATIRELASL